MNLDYLLEKHSNPNAPLVVLINGILADYQSFDGASFYAREYAHVLRYNCRGQSQYDKKFVGNDLENIITLKDHVEDLSNLLRSVLKDHGLISPVILVGLSNGGRIALKLSEDLERIHEFHIKAIVALDTYDELRPLLRLKLNSWYEATLIGGALHRFDVATPWIWGESFFNEKEDVILSYRAKIIESNKNSTSMNVIGLLRGALRNISEEDRIDLEHVSIPVLLIVGSEDLLTTPECHRDMLTRLPKGKLVEIPKMGHAGLIENPKVMRDEIYSFINSIVMS